MVGPGGLHPVGESGTMTGRQLLVCAARRLGSRLMLPAVAGLLIVAVMLALPLVALAQMPDATLSALSLSSGALRPTFAASTTEYRAAVQYNVSQITVTATPATGATVEYLDASDLPLADANAGTTGHQVDLGVGETAFKVKVTSGADTETYTVTVERDSAHLFGWTPTRDINALEAAGNANPQGIWSDGTTMWVADDDRRQALRLHAGDRRPHRHQGHQPAHRQRRPTGHLVRRDHHVGRRRWQTTSSTPTRWRPAPAMQPRTSACTPTTATLQASGPTGQPSGLPTTPSFPSVRSSPIH